MQRLVINATVIVFTLLINTASFGMVPFNQDNGVDTVLKDPFPFGTLLKELQIRVINVVNDPLPLGQTSKQNYTMVEKLGMDNIRTVYKLQNPRLMLSLYVPMISMNISASRKENCRNWVYISPYQQSFYSEIDEQIDFKELKMLENTRYCQMRAILGIEYYCNKFNHPIVSAALFGNDKDVLTELNKYKKYFGTFKSFDNPPSPGHIVWTALNVLIRYPDTKNNAFELLLKDKKEDIAKKDNFYLHADSFYTLLLLADKYKNKKAFAALVTQDPYCANNLLYEDLGSCTKQTILDRMLADGCFDPENVKLFITAGGKTTQQLQQL